MNRRKFFISTGLITSGGILYAQKLTQPSLATDINKINLSEDIKNGIELEDNKTLNIPFDSFEISGENINNTTENLNIFYNLLDYTDLSIIESTIDSIEITNDNFTIETDNKNLSIEGDDLKIRENEYLLQVKIEHSSINTTVESDRFKIDNKFEDETTNLYLASSDGIRSFNPNTGEEVNNNTDDNNIYGLLTSDMKYLYAKDVSDDKLHRLNMSDLTTNDTFEAPIVEDIEYMYKGDEFLFVGGEGFISKLTVSGEIDFHEDGEAKYTDDDIISTIDISSDSSKLLWSDKNYIYAGGKTRIHKIDIETMEEEDSYEFKTENFEISELSGFNEYIYIGNKVGEVIKINKKDMSKEDNEFKTDKEEEMDEIMDIIINKKYAYVVTKRYFYQLNKNNMEVRHTSREISSGSSSPGFIFGTYLGDKIYILFDRSTSDGTIECYKENFNEEFTNMVDIGTYFDFEIPKSE